MAETAEEFVLESLQGFRPDERLFHYTNRDGLFGILNTQCVWATDYRFLNDTSEFSSALDALTVLSKKKFLIELARIKVNHGLALVSGLNKETWVAEQANDMSKYLHQYFLDKWKGFVFSTFRPRGLQPVTHAADNLLHWAVYGRGGGYALQFNPKLLFELFSREFSASTGTGLICQSAAYARTGEVPSELRSQFDDIATFMGDLLSTSLLSKERRAAKRIGETAVSLLRALTLTKDVFFRDEAEFRMVLVSDPTTESPIAVHFRDRSGVQIPYTKLFSGFLSEGECPLEAVILGPHPDNNSREDELRRFLDQNGLHHIDVVRSKAPYRHTAFG